MPWSNQGSARLPSVRLDYPIAEWLRRASRPHLPVFSLETPHAECIISPSTPLDANEGADGDTLLLVELDLIEQELAQFEWVEEGKDYREWLIPAALINAKAKVQIVEETD